MYSVLYVDDEPDLLSLTKIFLERSGEFAVDTAASAKEALASPAISRYDAIVSDYQMPEMDGITFLKEVRRLHGDIPFVLFTGRGREEVVIEAINHGVDSYIQKGGDPRAQFIELGNGVRRAVDRKRAELSLVESEKRLSDIINFLPDATFAIDREGRVISWNRAIEEMTGVSAAEMLGKGDYEYAVPFYGGRRKILIDLIFEPDEVIAESYANITRDKNILIADTALPRPRDRAATLMGMASPLYNRQGEIVGAIESIRDITGLKKAEEEVSRARKDWEAIFRAVGQPAMILDARNRVVDANDAMLAVTGSSLDEMKGRHCYEVFHDPGTAGPPAACPFERLKETGLPETTGTEIEALGGYYVVTCTPVFDEDGRLDKVIHIAVDVTGRRKVQDELSAACEQLAASEEELKDQYKTLSRNERQLRESELRLTYMLGFYEMANRPEKELLDYAVEGAGAVTGSPLGYLAFLNAEETVLTMYAWSGAALRECSTREKPIVYPVANTGLWGDAVRERRPVITNDYEAPNPRKKGYPGGHPRIVRHMNVPVMDGDHIVIVAGVANKSSDYTEEDARALTLLMKGLWQVMERRRAGEELRAANEQLAATDEELRGQFEELASSEGRIRESETRFRELADLLPQGVYEADPDGRMIFVNRRALEMSGYTAADVEQGLNALRVIAPEDRTRAAATFRGMVETGTRTDGNVEYMALRRDGSTFPVSIFSSPVHRDGRIAGVRGVIIDMTEQKKTAEKIKAANDELAASAEELRAQFDELVQNERRIRESEEKFRTVVETAEEGVWIVDPEFLTVFTNRKMEEIIGYTADEMRGRPVWDFVPPGEAASMREILLERRAGKRGRYERQWVRKDGRVIWCLTSGSPLFLPDGTFGGSFGMFTEITERKAMEEALRVSEAKFRAIIDQSFQFIGLMRTDGTLVEVNRSALAFAGIAESDAVGRPFWETPWWTHSTGLRETLKDAVRRAASGETVRFEATHRAADGHLATIDFSIKPVVEKDGRINYLIPEGRDITVRKQAETALRESEEKYRAVVEQSQDAIFIAQDGHLVFWNRALSALTGYSDPELRGRPIAGLIAPEDREMVTSRHRKRLDGETPPGTYEFSVLHRDGTSRSRVIMHVGTLTFGGKPATLGTLRDVTGERKREEDLRESEENYRSLVDNVQDVIYRTDTAGNLTMASPSFAARLGYDIDECLGKNIAEHLWMYPDRRKEFLREIEEKGSVSGYEVVLRKKDGTPLIVSASSHHYRGRDGTVAGVEGIFHDITDAWKARQQIELLACLNDISPASVIVHTPEGEILYANERTFEMHGWTRDEFMALNLHEIDVPSSEALIGERIDELRRTGEAVFNVEHFRKDGSTIPLRVNTRVARWNDREVIMSVSTDVSDLKRAENEVRESEDRFRRLVSGSFDAVVVHQDGRIVLANERAAAITGASTPDDLIGRRVTDFVHPDFVSDVLERFLAMYLNPAGTVPPVEEKFIRFDGSQVDVEVMATASRHGGRPAVMTVFRDITDRKKAEKALRVANRKLHLLSSMTRHDILNKVSALLGFLKIAEQQCRDPGQHGYLEKMESAVASIRSHVEFTRVYQDLGTHEPQWIDLGAIVRGLNVSGPVHLASGVDGVSVFADLMLGKVFHNLLDNSLRHGGHVSEIRVSSNVTGEGLLIVWEDDGTGIPADDKERIFERGFGRHNGFGLFLSREILSLTGITIRETGEEGKGARFEIVVPDGQYRSAGTP